MKNIILKVAAVFAALFIFALTSCSGIIGYSVVLWNIGDQKITDGTVVPVYLKSNISHVYVISAPDSEEKIEVPLWKLSEPKSKGKAKKHSRYLLNDFELEKIRKNPKYKITGLQRYKGLGEMDANQLWETTLDPENRVLAQISISDTVEADEITTMLMSTNVPPRREFIMEEAQYATVDL